jgi:signal transduction histidine kinase
MSRRWRPPLALVLGGGLAGTLALSLAGLVALRYLGPEIGFRNAALLLALVIALATAGLGWLLLRLLLRPIRALERFAAAGIGPAAPAPPRHFGTRELHATALRVIAMTEALRDRFATVRAFTDHVTHELKTPVSAIRAAAELMEDGGALSEGDRRLLAGIDGARRQIEAQLDALRRVAAAREVRYLGRCTLAGVLPDLRRDHPALAVNATGAEQGLPIAADGLALVLGQLLRNAAENGATRVDLDARATETGCTLRVADDGRGVSPGNAGRIFEPFFTTRREAGGTGAGLTVVRTLLQAHRADIALSPSDSGAAFLIVFGGAPEP